MSLDALKNKNYKKLFVASLTSNVGSWVETVVIGIFMQALTHSASLVGVAFAMRYAANIFMAPLGGWCADRFNRKNLLMLMNLISSIIAFSIGFMVSQGSIKPWMLILFVGLTGVIDSISFPTYQAFISELVPKDIYKGAVSLIFAQWNMARIIGPAFAAILVGNDHFEFAFYVNGLSFWAVVVTLFMIKTLSQPRDEISKLKWTDGVRWIFKEQKLSRVVLIHGASVFFAGGTIAILPNIADEVYHSRVFGTSALNISMAIGAIAITVLYASLTHKYGKNNVLSFIAKLVPFSVAAFGLAPNLFLACIAISVFGVAHLGTLTSIVTEIQMLAPSEMKGKVTSVFSALLGGFFLFASLLCGFLVDHFGSKTSLVSLAICHFVVQIAIGLYTDKWKLPELKSSIEDIQDEPMTPIAEL